MHAKPNRPRLEELVARYQHEVRQPADEIITRLYETLLSIPEIKLADGRTAKVEVYYPPEANDDDQMHCGVDVRLSDGNLLEFTLSNTGWERSFVKEIEKSNRYGRQARS